MQAHRVGLRVIEQWDSKPVGVVVRQRTPMLELTPSISKPILHLLDSYEGCCDAISPLLPHTQLCLELRFVSCVVARLASKSMDCHLVGVIQVDAIITACGLPATHQNHLGMTISICASAAVGAKQGAAGHGFDFSCNKPPHPLKAFLAASLPLHEISPKLSCGGSSLACIACLVLLPLSPESQQTKTSAKLPLSQGLHHRHFVAPV